MIVENKTHYISEYTRSYNALPDQNSFSVQSSKRMGYFQRLWFEYAYCRKVNGIAFFHTLTYNDSHIPKYRGRNCFSYDDIRYITNGALSKWLLRNYGSVLKYFVACETGEGKGVRGLGNNPHYHLISFVEPANNPDYPYKKVTPKEFNDKIYELWQGKPKGVFVPWQLAKFGHVQEGLYQGEILSAEAFKYVGKYVVKDSSEVAYEQELISSIKQECLKYGITTQVLYWYYKYLLFTDSSITSKYDFLDYFPIRQYWSYRKAHKDSLNLYDFSKFCRVCVGKNGLVKSELLEKWFVNYYVPQYCAEKLSEYRNKYSPKARMSKSLGEYGIQFVHLVDGCPRVVLNTSKGYEVQFPCLYYIRKLFYNVKLCPYTGNPLYYLNDYGIKMKLLSLQNSLDRCIADTKENMSFVQLNNIHLPSDNLSDGYDTLFNQFVKRTDLDEVLRRYAVYHVIYQYRSFDKFVYLDSDCKSEDYKLDYSLFLRNNSYYLDFQSCSVFDLKRRKVSLSFSSHSAFIDYIDVFKLLDVLNDTIDNIVSNSKKRSFADKSSHMKRLNAYKHSMSLEFLSQEPVFADDPVTSSEPYILYEQLSLIV